ncbi:MAG: DUF4810 domain-containing protein [Curvibacter lanceolatus]|jgi:hypothetical protein|uniref:DUF4810 domain-containing protein n=1 Tax=Curvibacter lanceolatus TaxID=86182 RepID=UPI002352F9D1|nr:DUF4810 domain-containing protein [Curvibacter lanceolatus]MBV5293652.1 DUF4810 domain-containing protein [Curvibacter lanceolatus]
MRIYSWLSLATASIVLAACAGPPTLYQWGPYEAQLYSHFKSESPQAQIDVMEKHAKIVREAGQSLPPGYMAHLAVLYGQVGRDADQRAALQMEKDSFPESKTYIDSLMGQSKLGMLDAKK